MMKIQPLPHPPAVSRDGAGQEVPSHPPVFVRPSKTSGRADGAPGRPSDTPADPGNGRWHDIASNVYGSAAEFGGAVLAAPGQAASHLTQALVNHRSTVERTGESLLGAAHAGGLVVATTAFAGTVVPGMVVSAWESARGQAFPPAHREDILRFGRAVITPTVGAVTGTLFGLALNAHGVRNVNRGIENAVAQAGQIVNPPAARFLLQD